jgi:ACS family tartrate transporter-like MFS transporter
MNAAAARGFAKAERRIVPLLFFVYITSYLDRVNVAFAAPTMSKDLGFTASIYGFAAGIFFLSYAALEIPSNLLSVRFGVRLWLTRIMITWGVLAMLTGFVNNASQFIVIRFLLGAAEAGAFPMIMLYLTSWTPRKKRGRIFGYFIASVAVAGVIGSPLSGVLLTLDGLLGIEGWRWLFFAEGVPALVLGLIVFRSLPNKASEARWLTSEEIKAVEAHLEKEYAEVSGHLISLTELRHSLKSLRVWALGGLALFELVGLYSISLWAPIFVYDAFPDLSQIQLGFVNSIPFIAGALGMIFLGRSSDHFQERKWHLVIPLLVAVTALLTAAHLGVNSGFWFLVIAAAAIYGISPVLWSMAPEFMVGRAAAGGFALVNSVGAIGGFIGPYSVGELVQKNDGNPTAALQLVACSLCIAAVLAFFIARSIAAQNSQSSR